MVFDERFTMYPAAKRLLAILIIFSLFFGCSLVPKKKDALEEDFLDPITDEERRAVWEEIAELRTQIINDYDNAELHRKLAVKYRLAGTPRSRLLSTEEIDKAIRLDPLNALNYVEKGLTLRARCFYGDAEHAFNRAVEIDPKCFEAYHQLARLERREYQKTMCFPEHLRKSIGYYKKAYRIDRKDEEVLFCLGFLHMFRQMFVSAKKYAKKAVTYHPDSYRAHLLLATVYYQIMEFENSESEFNAAFEIMDEETRGIYEDISPVLPPDQRELYLSSASGKKLEWIRKYWIELDPTPSTEINERRLEHYKRVFLAQELLTDNRLELQGEETDRGKALICYGLPHKKYYDLGALHLGAWLVWHYSFPHYTFRLYFHDEFLTGNYHFPIYDRYGEISLNIMKHIPQVYEYPVEYTLLPMRVEAAQLRGSDQRTRIEFSIAMSESVLRQAGGDWIINVTFFDNDYNRISMNHFSFEPDTLMHINRLGEYLAVLNSWVELLPRPLESTCVIEVINDEAQYKGTWRYPLEIRDLYGRSLKVSSIKFTIEDEEMLCSDVLDPFPAYTTGKQLCLSYHIYNLKKDSNNRARYRLTYIIRSAKEFEDKTGIGKTLAYMWSSITGKKDGEAPYITSSLEQSTSLRTVSDRLQIDLGTLEQGNYLLALDIEDLNSQQKTYVEREFFIID